jgi:hypothetical protein
MKKQSKQIDKEKMKKRTVLTAQYVTQVAVMAGLITALKFALSFLPNVELITLLIAVFSTVWGLKYSLPATIVFCLVEMAIYGVGSWLLLYIIYWPLLAVIFYYALRNKKTPVAMGISVGIGLIMTVAFGVLSACTDTLFVIGAVSKDMLGTYFVSYYLKGLWFDIIHVISVVISLLVLYIPLVKVCERIRKSITRVNVMAENEEIAVENIDENDGLLQDTTVETSCQDMKDTFDNCEK